MNMVFAGAIVLTLVARLAAPTKAPGRDVGLTLIIGFSIGMAAAAPVLLRSINISAALYLLACAALYDAGAYLVGTGASSAWEGPAAGVVALLPLTMAAAVVLVPPFHGGAPLLLGLWRRCWPPSARWPGRPCWATAPPTPPPSAASTPCSSWVPSGPGARPPCSSDPCRSVAHCRRPLGRV